MRQQGTHDVTPKGMPAPAKSMARSGRLLRAAMWLYVIYALAVMGILKPFYYYGIDYDKHWFAARALLEGKTLYIGGTLWMGFNYPQATALPFFWLGYFDVKTAEYLWKIVLLTVTVGCWALGARCYRPDLKQSLIPFIGGAGTIRAGVARHWGLTIAFLTGTYFAATSSIYLGNIDPINGFLTVAMVAAVFSGMPLLAGIAWGCLTLIKMMPLVLIVPVVFWRQWRVLQGFALTLVVYFFVLVALGRVGEEWYFVREAIPAIPLWWRIISISPLALVMRTCGLARYFDDANTFAIAARYSAIALAGLFLLLNIAMRRRRFDWIRGLEGALVFLPLMSPLLEYHHFVWIMPVLFLQARRWVLGDIKPWMAVALIVAWLALDSAYHVTDLFPKGTHDTFLHFSSMPGYLAVLTLTLIDLFVPRRPIDCGMRDADCGLNSPESPASLPSSLSKILNLKSEMPNPQPTIHNKERA